MSSSMNTEELVQDPWGSRLIGLRLSESFDSQVPND